MTWTWTISPTLINEARATRQSRRCLHSRQHVGNRVQPARTLTRPSPIPTCSRGKDIPGKIPTVNLNDNFYSLAGGPYPSHSSGPIYTASDSVTKVWRNHTFKFGVYFEYSGENDGDQINVSTVPGGSNNQNGNFTFTDSGTGAHLRREHRQSRAWDTPTATPKSDLAH